MLLKMRNKKGFEMAISTIIVIALGVILLAALSYMLTDGFKQFKNSSKPLWDTAESVSVKEACSLSCTAQDSYGYCCRKHKIENMNITCMDSRLGVECNIKCENIKCNQ